MKRQILFFGIVLLSTVQLTLLAQSKTKAPNKAAKPVTVTLVRWPYT